MTREEAINEIKSWDFLEGKEIEAIHTLIPELRESEDERIRKVLIHIVKSACSKYGIKYIGDKITEEMLLAYLERQKEQPTNSEIPKESKPEWTEADEKMLSVITYKISQHQGNDERSLFTPDEAEFICEIEDKFKSLRPSWKPTEEQMTAILRAEGVLRLHEQEEVAKRLAELYEQLKKLKEDKI